MGECGAVARYNCNKGERVRRHLKVKRWKSEKLKKWKSEKVKRWLRPLKVKRWKVPGNKWFGLITKSDIKPKSACTDFVYCWVYCLPYSLDVARTPPRKRQTGCRQTNEGGTGNDENNLKYLVSGLMIRLGLIAFASFFPKETLNMGK